MNNNQFQIRKMDFESANRQRLHDMKANCGAYSAAFIVFMLLGGICAAIAIEAGVHGLGAMIPFSVGVAVWCALQRGDLLRDISILESQMYGE